ncbi:tetratricopeptide repeat protein [Patescibacteria group bacterium]
MSSDKSNRQTHSLAEYLKDNSTIIVFLMFVVLVVYLNSINNDFVSDDVPGIVHNPIIGSWKYLKQATSTYPSRLIFHTISFQIGGKNPMAYRLPIIAFHFLNSCLVYALFEKQKNKRFGLLTASLFAVHPVLTESVVWVSAGSYVYGTFFMLLSFVLYVKGTFKHRLLSAFSFCISLTFTLFTLFLPFALVVFELISQKKYRSIKRIVPHFVVLIVLGLFGIGLVNYRLESMAQNYGGSLLLRNPLETIPFAVSTYLELFLWPQNLTFYHSDLGFSLLGYSTVVLNSAAKILKMVLFLSFLFGYIWSFFKDKFIFFWATFFIMSIVVSFSPVAITSVVSERYVYAGSVGLFAVATQIFSRVFKQRRNAMVIAVSIVVIILGVRTILRNADWKHENTLWVSAAKVSPSSYQNHNNLGVMYLNAGNVKQAEYEFTRAIELFPKHTQAMNNLAILYYRTGNYERSITLSNDVISFDPGMWQGYSTLAKSYLALKDFISAYDNAILAIKLHPADTGSILVLALIEIENNNNQRAAQLLNAILQIDPQNSHAIKLSKQLQTPIMDGQSH